LDFDSNRELNPRANEAANGALAANANFARDLILERVGSTAARMNDRFSRRAAA